MAEPSRLARIRSDYIGAGSYAVYPDDDGVAVNTTYGVQSVSMDGKVRWQADLGQRCLGLAWNQNGELLANTVHAAHRLSAKGDVLATTPTRHEVAHGPVAWGDRVVLVTLTRIYVMDATGEVIWKYRFRESLGESVRAVFVCGVITTPDHIVVGAVDYNSGIGQALVFDASGKKRWQSELGPLTGLFPGRREPVRDESLGIQSLRVDLRRSRR